MEGLVVVAMSGGVDSSVAALLLAQEGKQTIGISMQVWDYRNNGGCASKVTCCAPDDFTDARKVAASIGIPYYVFDFEQTFRREVIERFVRTYQEGETPNPCIDCNSKVKFKELRGRAESLGCTHVATGHYAQIRRSDEGYHLLRGVDRAKDQSYFLYGLTQEELSQTLFPVGHMKKDEVRAIAHEAGLVTASKPESQDICFVSGSVQDFLVRLGGRQKGGEFVTRNGAVVGSHDGVHNFTVGQRRGLNLGGFEEPLYVLEIDPITARVVVGRRDELARHSFQVGQLNWVAPTMSSWVAPTMSSTSSAGSTFETIVQLRSRHEGTRAKVTIRDDVADVSFVDEWTHVSPGQAAVFYDLTNQEVLGGGRILRERT